MIDLLATPAALLVGIFLVHFGTALHATLPGALGGTELVA
jgi:hypothetical protein